MKFPEKEKCFSDQKENKGKVDRQREEGKKASVWGRDKKPKFQFPGSETPLIHFSTPASEPGTSLPEDANGC